jgi:hypothetical protein
MNTNLKSHATYEGYLAFVYSTVSSCDVLSLVLCSKENNELGILEGMDAVPPIILEPGERRTAESRTGPLLIQM